MPVRNLLPPGRWRRQRRQRGRRQHPVRQRCQRAVLPHLPASHPLALGDWPAGFSLRNGASAVCVVLPVFPRFQDPSFPFPSVVSPVSRFPRSQVLLPEWFPASCESSPVLLYPVANVVSGMKACHGQPTPARSRIPCFRRERHQTQSWTSIARLSLMMAVTRRAQRRRHVHESQPGKVQCRVAAQRLRNRNLRIKVCDCPTAFRRKSKRI